MVKLSNTFALECGAFSSLLKLSAFLCCGRLYLALKVQLEKAVTLCRWCQASLAGDMGS